MSEASPEALAVAAYAVLLLGVAIGLERLARHSYRRSGRYRTAGFTYHGHLDAWECPEGQHLHRFELDHERRVVRYRGRPHICNACPRKSACTDSDRGREIVQPIDPWPHSEAGRFHRGISLALVALAAVMSLAELARHHGATDAVALGAVLATIALVGPRLLSGFRNAASGFPAPGAAGPADPGA